jgi:hypothetical protein
MRGGRGAAQQALQEALRRRRRAAALLLWPHVVALTLALTLTLDFAALGPAALPLGFLGAPPFARAAGNARRSPRCAARCIQPRHVRGRQPLGRRLAFVLVQP